MEAGLTSTWTSKGRSPSVGTHVGVRTSAVTAGMRIPAVVAELAFAKVVERALAIGVGFHMIENLLGDSLTFARGVAFALTFSFRFRFRNITVLPGGLDHSLLTEPAFLGLRHRAVFLVFTAAEPCIVGLMFAADRGAGLSGRTFAT